MLGNRKAKVRTDFDGIRDEGAFEFRAAAPRRENADLCRAAHLDDVAVSIDGYPGVLSICRAHARADQRRRQKKRDALAHISPPIAMKS